MYPLIRISPVNVINVNFKKHVGEECKAFSIVCLPLLGEWPYNYVVSGEDGRQFQGCGLKLVALDVKLSNRADVVLAILPADKEVRKLYNTHTR